MVHATFSALPTVSADGFQKEDPQVIRFRFSVEDILVELSSAMSPKGQPEIL
jgi:hypothetical protein